MTTHVLFVALFVVAFQVINLRALPIAIQPQQEIVDSSENLLTQQDDQQDKIVEVPPPEAIDTTPFGDAKPQLVPSASNTMQPAVADEPVQNQNGKISPLLTTSTTPSGSSKPFVNEEATPSLETGLWPASPFTAMDPNSVFEMLQSQLEQSDLLMSQFMSPFSGMPGSFGGGFPFGNDFGFGGSQFMKPIRNRLMRPMIAIPPMQIPSIDISPEDMEIVADEKIEDGPIQGQYQHYVSKPDPNKKAETKVAKFSINDDNGSAKGHAMVSTSSSHYSTEDGSLPPQAIKSWSPSRMVVGGGFPRLQMGFPQMQMGFPQVRYF